MPSAAEIPAYKYRSSLRGTLDTKVRRYAGRNRLEYKNVNWQVNEHMGVSRRSQAAIRQLEAGIAFVDQMGQRKS